MSEENGFLELPIEGVLEASRRHDNALAVIEGVKGATESLLVLERERHGLGYSGAIFRCLAAAIVFALLGYFWSNEWYFGVVVAVAACLHLFHSESVNLKQQSALQDRLDELRFRWISSGHQPSAFDSLVRMARTADEKDAYTECETWWADVQLRNANTVRAIFRLPELPKD